MSHKKVILDHAGGWDDMTALCLLASTRGPREKSSSAAGSTLLLGVILTECGETHSSAAAADVCGKILAMLEWDSSTVSIGRSTLPFSFDKKPEGATNLNDLPCMNTPAVLATWEKNGRYGSTLPGQDLLAQLVMDSWSPVTLCITGPLGNVAYCIEKYGTKFTNNIACLVVRSLYWDNDTAATGTVLGAFTELHPLQRLHTISSHQRLVLLSQGVPLISDFVRQFGKWSEQSLVAQFLGCAWAMRGSGTPHTPSYAESSLAAAYVIDPTLVKNLEKRSVAHSCEALCIRGGIDGKKFYDFCVRCCAAVTVAPRTERKREREEEEDRDSSILDLTTPSE